MTLAEYKAKREAKKAEGRALQKVIEKYLEFGETDPFPEIEPALLNSADIYDYVEKIGMINPFYKENLKPASYGVRLKGEYVYWDSESKRIAGMLEHLTDRDEENEPVFILKSNSIAYIQLEPEFRFPSYIAARFNLKIKHIYQGILLGTGPLVDPGYEGKIFIPLHNLTNNDYKIRINVPFIWMEFTKLSSNQNWYPDYRKCEERKGEYISFNKQKLKNKKTLSDYINDAHPNAPVLSTITGFFKEINESIKSFEDRIKKNETAVKETTDAANKATTQFNRAIMVSLIAVTITIIVTIFQTVTIHNKTIDYLKEYDKRQIEEHTKFMNEASGIIELKKEVNELNNKLQKQVEEINKLKK